MLVARSMHLSLDLPCRPAGAFLLMGFTDAGKAELVAVEEVTVGDQRSRGRCCSV